MIGQLEQNNHEDNGIVHDNKIIFEYLSEFEEKNRSIQLSLFDELL